MPRHHRLGRVRDQRRGPKKERVSNDMAEHCRSNGAEYLSSFLPAVP
jgi:hypothetical protein